MNNNHINKGVKLIFTAIVFLYIPLTGISQTAESWKDCQAMLLNDTLYLRNSKMEYKLVWNKGNVSHYACKELTTGKLIVFDKNSNGFYLESAPFSRNISFRILVVDKTSFSPAHLSVEIVNEHQSLDVKRTIRIYPQTASVTFDYYLRYESLGWSNENNEQKIDGTEAFFRKNLDDSKAAIERFGLDLPHWRYKAVRFLDVTDKHDNLVLEQVVLPYTSSQHLQGNLLMVQNLINETTLFVLKEAPNGKSQINYPGFDFSISQRKGIVIPFSGYEVNSLSNDWIKGYPVTVGIAQNERFAEWALKDYLKNTINYHASEYEMIMMNTWGDRGQDGRVQEAFILKELDVAKELGITHFQIDDGWQQGLSKNSASKEGKLWQSWRPEDWQPHKLRFPNGLAPVVEKARKNEIKLGLWFNPSQTNDYENWESDANVIIDLHKKTGIQYFKIDGIEFKNKTAEQNLKRFFEKIKTETSNGVFFNLDLTAGTRGGYFSFRYAGNLFLENRYTDWANYYPYRTLRNVWMLATYFPTELLQVEFLNPWRNMDKYSSNDLFAPSCYTFDYLFATAMAGQPLAWFEATGLPAEAMETGALIKKYHSLQADFHAGTIFPVGDEPSGKAWTGFHSKHPDNKHGFLLIYREKNDEKTKNIPIPFLAKGKYSFTVLLGEGENSVQTINDEYKVNFSLPNSNSYQLVRYDIISNN